MNRKVTGRKKPGGYLLYVHNRVGINRKPCHKGKASKNSKREPHSLLACCRIEFEIIHRLTHVSNTYK